MNITAVAVIIDSHLPSSTDCIGQLGCPQNRDKFTFEEVGELSKTVDGQNRAVVEVSPTSITDGEWDLLYAVEGQRVELYRARDDAGHRQDLSETRPEVVRDLQARYVRWLQSIDAPQCFLAPRLRL